MFSDKVNVLTLSKVVIWCRINCSLLQLSEGGGGL